MGSCCCSTGALISEIPISATPEPITPETFKCYKCYKDQTVEYSNPVCPKCKLDIARLKICEKCPKEYLARIHHVHEDKEYFDTPPRCEECRGTQYCLICGVENLKRICDHCFRTRPKCACCRKRLKERRQLIHGESYCKKCAPTVKTTIGDRTVLPQKLEVIYQKKTICREYSQPCPQVTHYTTTKTRYTRIYPVISEAIDPKQYLPPDEKCCDYCHAGTFYRIVSTKLI